MDNLWRPLHTTYPKSTHTVYPTPPQQYIQVYIPYDRRVHVEFDIDMNNHNEDEDEYVNEEKEKGYNDFPKNYPKRKRKEKVYGTKIGYDCISPSYHHKLLNE